jgi:hypothetical protein
MPPLLTANKHQRVALQRLHAQMRQTDVTLGVQSGRGSRDDGPKKVF